MNLVNLAILESQICNSNRIENPTTTLSHHIALPPHPLFRFTVTRAHERLGKPKIADIRDHDGLINIILNVNYKIYDTRNKIKPYLKSFYDS